MSLLMIVIGLLGCLLVAAVLYNAGYLDNGLASVKALFVSSQVDNALRRMWPLWLLFAVCFAVVLLLNPLKAGLTLYGIGKIALAGPVGYLIDYCCTARKHRPENLEDGIALGTALKCRTFVICAAILALAFGVP